MSKEIEGKKYGRLYLKEYKKYVVELIEKEGSAIMICERLGISKTAVRRWIKEFASTEYHNSRSKRRSVIERGQIAREIVYGDLTIEEAQLKYNIGCRETLLSWVRQYKKVNTPLIPAQAPVESVVKNGSNLSLASEEFEYAQLKIRALETMLDIASKDFKVDIRKKYGAKQ